MTGEGRAVEHRTTRWPVVTLRVAHGFLLCGAAFLTLLPILRLPFVYFTAADGFYVLAIMTFLLSLPRSARLPMTVDSRGTGVMIVLVLGLGIGVLISSALNGDPLRGLVVAGQYAFAWGAVPLAIMFSDERVQASAARWFLLGVVVVVGTSIALFIVFKDSPLNVVLGEGRMASLMENPNELAKTLAASLGLAGVAYTMGVIGFASYAVLVGVSLLGMMFTGSVSGALLCASILIWSTCMMGKVGLVRRWATAAFVVTLLLASGAAVPVAFQERILGVLGSGDVMSLGTVDQKATLLGAAWVGLPEWSMLGRGADSFAAASGIGLPVHNTYLLLWYEGGLLSMLLFQLLLAQIGLMPVWLARGESRRASWMVVGIVAVFAAGCMTNTHVYARHWSVPLFLAVALTGRRRVNSGNAHVPASTSPR